VTARETSRPWNRHEWIAFGVGMWTGGLAVLAACMWAWWIP